VSDKKIAFQGEPGAYSELAAVKYYGKGVETLPCETFEEVFNAVEEGQATHGLLPIENSLAGSIHRNYDLLLENELHILGEYHLRVSHCLMSLPGMKVDEVQRVHSHPQALAQCAKNLQGMGVKPVVEEDTAGSARLVSERKYQHAAALASKRAAEVYGLEVLIEGMEDNPANYTRFMALARGTVSRENGKREEEYKTSLVFSLHNEPGALYHALKVFAERNIDLTKIESRPIQGKPWEYMFYIDFAEHARSQVGRRALGDLDEMAPFMRVLGSYPRHRMMHELPPEE